MVSPAGACGDRMTKMNMISRDFLYTSDQRVVGKTFFLLGIVYDWWGGVMDSYDTIDLRVRLYVDLSRQELCSRDYKLQLDGKEEEWTETRTRQSIYGLCTVGHVCQLE